MSEVHQPYRGSDVEAWLKAQRDRWPNAPGTQIEWRMLDDLLEQYRLKADTGLLLQQTIEEAGP